MHNVRRLHDLVEHVEVSHPYLESLGCRESEETESEDKDRHAGKSRRGREFI